MNGEIITRNAVDTKTLASNFIDIIGGCGGVEGFSLRNELQAKFPLATWLSGTSMARQMRRRSADPQYLHHGGENESRWVMDIPGTAYTADPTNRSEDCCWTLPEFAKCAGNVPILAVCLKDCENVLDNMVYKDLNVTSRAALAGLSLEGETLEQTENRIRHLWMAFYEMHTAILGTTQTSDNIVKPFHGLLEVMAGDAVVSVNGANLLAAFDSVGCRMDALGGSEWVFAGNPLIYRTLEAVATPDERGVYPAGWGRDANGRLTFHGAGFIDDRTMPVDMSELTGDIWLIDGNSTGLFLKYNIGEEKEIKTFAEQTLANGCGQNCTYLYNYGAVANNNANRVMVISDVPVSTACTQIADLASIVNAGTLIPA